MLINKDFNHSYWETKFFRQPADLLVIGGGIVGLSTAISFKQKHKKSKVLVLERGILPNGASTKNAGFACFGSAGELLDDLTQSSEQTVFETVHMRWTGLQMLRQRLGDKAMALQRHGGFELFENTSKYDQVFSQLTYLNKQILQICKLPKCFKPSTQFQNSFKGVKAILKNQHEAQIDTGLMMHNLHQLALSLGIQYYGGVEVQKITELAQQAAVHTPAGSFLAFQVVVATNGFAKSLLNIQDLHPARAQVLVTHPIPNLHIKGTFHFDQGYYYFRNIDQRILFGGGRNLDIKGETTSQQGLHSAIQQRLNHLLKNKILVNTPFQIDQRWSGIMGVGKEKKPIIQRCSPHVTAAVRMGGMGVAIGSLVGAHTADLIA